MKGTSYSAVDSQLGQRFIDVHWQLTNSNTVQGKIDECISVYGHDYMEKKLVPEMKDAIKEVLDRAKATQSPKIGKLYPEAISELASCVATLKGNVPRDHN